MSEYNTKLNETGAALKSTLSRVGKDFPYLKRN
ncbi:hypothetical protein NSE_0300 [Neorickettsia sennetsu str. Miyayama]|uniref:Uncharacterized protein n=1 Tax=Ehrlichia sennetsu (strain ATCC VR-367 / Miyayama) TaxID=222891 RepID=Q2GEA6_EHRS3|nr:hypothetical protein NSE_0300 [Neorickettsia sennetsu str. Miyayama]